MKKIRYGVLMLLLGLMLLPVMGGIKVDAAAKVREGIDVSGYSNLLSNGTWKDIDWNAVKKAGKEFVYIRCGYRGPNDSNISPDGYFENNLRGALDAGLDVGVYFATQAINKEEAIDEADFTMELVNKVLKEKSHYELTLPIMIDFEQPVTKDHETRQGKAKLSRNTYNEICKAFCDRVESKGFTAGYYSNKDTVDNYLSENYLSSSYLFWYARYDHALDKNNVAFCQYAKDQKVAGVPVHADLNRQYINTPCIKADFNKSGKLVVSWSKLLGVNGYEVYRTSNKDNKEQLVCTLRNPGYTTYQDNNIERGVTYTYRVRAFIKTKNGDYKGDFSSKVSKTNGHYNITLKTNGGKIKSGNVSSYVYGNTVKLPTNVQRKGYTFDGWFADKNCKKNHTTTLNNRTSGDKTFYAKWTKIKLATPKIKTVKNYSSKKMVVNLKKKVGNADGYIIKYSLKSNMKSATEVKVKKASSLSTTVKKLKKGKTYYVQAYAYKYDSAGKQIRSAASNKVSVKIKK